MSRATAESGRDWQPSGNPWLIAVVVTLAAFMEVLDTTIVNVALPHIAGSMASSEDEATWALTSYLVANGIVLVISGYLGRLLGRNAIFSSASLCSRCAPCCVASHRASRSWSCSAACKGSSAAGCSRPSRRSFSIPSSPHSAPAPSR